MSLEDELLKQRLSRIREIEALGYRPYGRRFEFTCTIPGIKADYGAKAAEEISPEARVRVAGRLMTLRHMGKAGFAHLQQAGERLQIYVKKDAVSERDYQLFKLVDIGDIVGVDGYLFRTRTGELTVHVEKLEFLSKSSRSDRNGRRLRPRNGRRSLPRFHSLRPGRRGNRYCAASRFPTRTGAPRGWYRGWPVSAPSDPSI